MENSKQPNYKKIYLDIIKFKFPWRMNVCEKILSKTSLSNLDIIMIDKIIFGETVENQKHRSYDRESIFEILEFQKKNKMNNSQLAKHFKLSRNTVAKWRKNWFSTQA